jgi:hypothetical protein
VQKFHPYAVVFSTTVCSKCFAELARLKVVTTGGSGFSDEFHNANAPYSYDLSMSSTRMANQFAEFWCKQMTSQGNSGRTAIFAGTKNPAQNFRKSPRQLGVVSTNDPDNQATVQNVLYPALKRGCNDSVNGHEYFYAQDISTAQTQSQAGTSAMNTPNNPATSVVCFCDPVAPQFSYSAAAQNKYYPESLIAWPVPTRRSARSTTGSASARPTRRSRRTRWRASRSSRCTTRARSRCSRPRRTSSGATSTCSPA